MQFLIFVVTILISFYLLKRYLGVLLSFFLKRYFCCESVKLQECGLFFVKYAKCVFKSGITIEIESLRLSSGLLNQEYSKPIFLTLDDIRIESQRSFYDFDKKIFAKKWKNSEPSVISNDANNLFQFLQYVGARINCANIVLFEAVPDCLLHVSFENLQLETYRYKKGLQFELSYKLAQAKLFLRNFQRSVCLAELSLAGHFGLEMAETKFEIQKLHVALNNPRFSFFDDIFAYLSAHRSDYSNGKFYGSQNSGDLSTKFELLSRLPDLKFEIDSLTLQFIAETTRTLSTTVLNIDVEFLKISRRVSANFKEIMINDHASVSFFKCTQVLVIMNHSALSDDDAVLLCGLESNILSPCLLISQQDLIWWIDYVNRLDLFEYFLLKNQTNQEFEYGEGIYQKFADDFSRDFALHQIEEALKQQEKLKLKQALPKIFAESIETDDVSNSPKLSISLELEVNNLQAQLKDQDGADIVFGIELMTMTGSNRSLHLEFGVESLWCHRATGENLNFKFDLSRHRWGTAIAVGGALMELSKLSTGEHQLLVQLDECEFEWEESMILQLVSFVELFYRNRASTQQFQHFTLDAFKSKKYMVRDDSWSSIGDDHSFYESSENSTNLKLFGLLIKLSAKRLKLFLTARQSAFLVFTTDDWRFEADILNGIYDTSFDNLQIGQSEMRKHEEFFNFSEQNTNIRCGGVDKLSVNYAWNIKELKICDASSIELIWSTSTHLIILETFCTSKMVSNKLKKYFPDKPSNPEKSSRPILINASSEFSIELGFKLPRNHTMRWIVPSIKFEKTTSFSTIYAPTFLIEMDGNLILNVEKPMIHASPNEIVMNLNRQEFKQLAEKNNKVWTWSANAFELVFPYGYNFSEAFDEVINSVKWVKLVHGMKSRPFREDHRLPADVRLLFKRISLQINDDPFEIRLQSIYEVMMDEVFERERRRQMLEVKIAQLKKEDPLFPKAKVDALYNSLVKKDAQIYVERIRKIQQQPGRSLMLWVIRDFDARIYSDTTFNSKAHVIRQIRLLNPESPLPADSDFSTLWARAVELDFTECNINFRDYPLMYMIVRDAHFWGTLVGAEQLGGDRSTRQVHVDTIEPWGRYILDRNMCPLKFYYDLACEIEKLKSTYGPCWEPCLSMISLCWNLVNATSKDPSDPLPFWDKARLLLHGQFSMLCKHLVTSMLASTDPYNDTEMVELSWNNFEFDWISGEFRVQTDVDAFIRTASKYDDCRLFHLPKCKFHIQLDWDCLGDQHDHHSVMMCAPNKLPDYSTNVKHDSFRAFRSNNFSMVMRFEVKAPSENANVSDCQTPQILLYANTFKCLEFMKNTLTTIYRPVRRGALFNNLPSPKRAQLSAHLKNVNLSVTLPRFLISYWMSFSSPFGFRMISDSLNMTMAAFLRVSYVEKNDGITRRPRTSWKVSHMSAQLEKAEIHLFGDKRQPVVSNEENKDDGTSDSFFIGLSRLNYIREFSIVMDGRSVAKVSPRLNASADEKSVVHRLTAHDLKASWTTENRDICLVIAEGVQRAHILRKILDNEAMKMFKFNYDTNQYGAGQKPFNFTASTASDKVQSEPQSFSASPLDDSEEMLRKLVDEAGTNLVAYSEETVEHPTDSLHGVALCALDDVRLTNWQIDLLNSQLVLKGCTRAGFILVTAAKASVTQRFYYPIWRHAQLLLKRSWCAVLSGMQYFAPVIIGQELKDKEFRWLSREVIEEKTISDSSVTDKVNNYSSTGEAVGGVVADPFFKNHHYTQSTSNSATVSSHSDLQLQRVASRCSCQLFFCYFSDTINMEKTEEEDICIPAVMSQAAGKAREAGAWNRHEHKRCCEEVDCFTLKHNMLEVSTNADQYQMIIDIVNSLILFVDPKKTRAEESRRRLWFQITKKPKHYVKEQIVKMQSELREVVSIVRSLERQSYFLNKELLNAPRDPSLCLTSTQLQAEIDEYKTRQNALVDYLATMISCYKEKEVEEEAEAHRLRLVQEQQQMTHQPNVDPSFFDTPQAPAARRFEVCFEDCIWRLTESDGQISLAEMQIRNFLYTRTARIDNSGDHLLEIGIVKVLNLLPNSKYKETLARLPIDTTSERPSTEKTPSIRVICRELPPVGGISIKEHFEVNIAPMNAQITYRFFEKMMAFFFPGRNIDKEEQQNLDVADEQQSQQGFSLARRLRGAVNHSFRTAGASAAAAAMSSMNGPAESFAESFTANDEIDKMKERAKKNNMFLYIIIPPVPFVVSYKGNKEKNIEDVDRFDITFPIFEYHDRNWTWLDLALAMKQRCKRIILPQLLKQKLLRKRIMGVDRASLPNINTIDEEEKRRIVLGMMTADEKTKRKKKN